MSKAACVTEFGRLYALTYIYRNMSKKNEELGKKGECKGSDLGRTGEPGEARLLVSVLT